MSKEFDEKIEALQTMLHAAKEEEEDNPEVLREITPYLFQALLHVYGQFYQWYLARGAPGGESQSDFNAWLKMVSSKEEGDV